VHHHAGADVCACMTQSHVFAVLFTTCYMILSAAESNKVGPDGKAGSGPKKDGSGNKMSCSDRGMHLTIPLHVLDDLYILATVADTGAASSACRQHLCMLSCSVSLMQLCYLRTLSGVVSCAPPPGAAICAL
jgi:hypothetical protein